MKQFIRQHWRNTLLAIFALTFVISSGCLVSTLLNYRRGEESYARAANLVQLDNLAAIAAPALNQPDAAEAVVVDPYAEALQAMDFAALREVNSEVLGWILLPDTGISYPLLQHADNSYYLGHSWDKSSSLLGAIFLDSDCSSSLGDFNTIIYGHRMNNGSMFTPLQKFSEQSYWENHPNIYITDDNGVHRYAIFAAYEISTSGKTYTLSFANTSAKEDYIAYCLEHSVIDTAIEPSSADKIITLSTCTGRGHATRWIVQAVLQPEETGE